MGKRRCQRWRDERSGSREREEGVGREVLGGGDVREKYQ